MFLIFLITIIYENPIHLPEAATTVHSKNEENPNNEISLPFSIFNTKGFLTKNVKAIPMTKQVILIQKARL